MLPTPVAQARRGCIGLDFLDAMRVTLVHKVRAPLFCLSVEVGGRAKLPRTAGAYSQPPPCCRTSRARLLRWCGSLLRALRLRALARDGAPRTVGVGLEWHAGEGRIDSRGWPLGYGTERGSEGRTIVAFWTSNASQRIVFPGDQRSTPCGPISVTRATVVRFLRTSTR